MSGDEEGTVKRDAERLKPGFAKKASGLSVKISLLDLTICFFKMSFAEEPADENN
jgi:hypothetical protein